MNYFVHIVSIFLTSFAVQLVTLFLVPVILILAAQAMWRKAPRWVSIIVVAAAVIEFLAAVPAVLMHPLMQGWTGSISNLLGRQALQIVWLLNWLVGIAFAIAVLALARNMKTTTEQPPEA